MTYECCHRTPRKKCCGMMEHAEGTSEFVYWCNNTNINIWRDAPCNCEGQKYEFSLENAKQFTPIEDWRK